MSAGEAMRAALATALAAQPEFAGCEGLSRDTAPNALPQARVEVSGCTDWSAKGAEGREIRLATVIRVARGQDLRLPPMIHAAERIGAALGGAPDGWRIASAVLTGSRSAIQADGTRRAVIEHRIRAMRD